MNERMENTLKWLTKAKRDLASAQKLADGPNPIFDYAAFHCQQSAEKGVKAILVYNNKPWETRRGHDLSYLIGLAVEFDPDINSRIHERHSLTPLAVDPRYIEYGFGSESQYKEAFENAQSFYKYILSLLPPEAHPR